MASGGSSSRAASDPRSFDFVSDDVLCSYDAYKPQDSSNGNRLDSSAKDFHESRMGRPPVNVYSQQEEYSKEDVVSVVEKSMKKYADNLLQFLEGISGRLSQLELHCYKLDRSIGEFRSDMAHDQSETDLKLKSLEKHLQEVHRSVQILRDKQELADAQKELAKLQLEQKESTTLSHSQKNEEGFTPSVSEPKKHDEMLGMPNHQLALVPRQATAPLPLPARAPEQNQPYREVPMQQPAPASLNMPQDRYLLNQAGTYYAPQDQRSQPLQPELQYVQPRPQIQDQAPPAPPAPQPPFPQYQLQWTQPSPQQFPQQSVQPQQPTSQASTYPPYTPQQPTNPIHQQSFQGSMPVSYSTIPQPGGNRTEAASFGYGGPGSGVLQQPAPPHNMQQQQPPQPQGGGQSSFGPPVSKVGYMGAAPPYPPQPNVQGYSSTMYSIDGSRGAHSQNFHPGSYPTSNVPALQNQQMMLLPPASNNNSIGLHHPGQQLVRNHSYGEMIEKAVSMGYNRNQVASVIHRMGETGQPVDLNAVLDRLNTHGTGGASSSQRGGWSG